MNRNIGYCITYHSSVVRLFLFRLLWEGVEHGELHICSGFMSGLFCGVIVLPRGPGSRGSS